MSVQVLKEERRRGGSGGLFRLLSSVSLSVLALGSLDATATAQPTKDAQPAKADQSGKATPVVLVERAALDKMVVDPKDAALARAIGMLPARLRELPGEIPGFGQIPPPVFDLALAVIGSPARFGITYNDEDKMGGAFGVGLVASLLTGGEDQAQTIHGTINGFAAQGLEELNPHESTKFPGMTEIRPPVAKVIRYGPRHAADGWRYEIHAGSAGDPDAMFATLPAPARPGFQPVLRARIDLAALTPLAEQFRAMAGGDPQADQGFEAMEKAGLFGEGGVRYSYQYGYLPDRSLSVSITEGAKKRAAAMGVSTAPLTADDFKCIPADSYMAGLRRIDLDAAVKSIQGLRESQPQLADGIAKFQQATGVDPVTDVLGAIGGTVGWYISDSTGGLGLMSAVVVAQLKDRAKFDAASAKLMSFANAALANPTKGYFRARSWADGDAKMVSLTFPGLPVPLELTYTTTDRYVIFAASPQAAVAAARQAMGKGDGGLMANAAFAAGLPKGKDFESIGFTDTPRTMSAGYQFVTLIGSAIANVARSPRDPSREPGMLVPPLNELRKDARARIAFGYWDGDNLIRETHGNRSVLVETCGSAGAASPFIPVIVAAVAAAGLTAQNHGNPFPHVAPPPPMDGDEDDAAPPPPAPPKKRPPSGRPRPN